uniref:Uncharacterized protein n=1 Tax=Kalanchoe fedtschenkoi TaxID=63787 RepID=A0A7N0TK15_KALFE
MGCGSSTLAAENADIQARVRPIIKRRIDDIKRRRGHLKDSTLSKKELLAGEDCDKVSTNNDSLGRKSMPSEGSIEHGAAKIVPVVEEEEEEEEEAETSVECPKKNADNSEEGQEKTEMSEETEQENSGGDLYELGENDEDEGRCISPGSPSFRFYCVESIPHDAEEDDHASHIDSPKQVLETKNIEEHPASAESAEVSCIRFHIFINISFPR